MQQQITEITEEGNCALSEDESRKRKPEKSFLERIDNFYLAFLGAFIVPYCIHGIFGPMISSIVEFFGKFLSRNLHLLLLGSSPLLSLAMGAWLAGMILGAWMPKNSKKAIKWFYGITIIPFYIYYIFPQLQSIWSEYKPGETSIFRLISFLMLPLFIYPAIFLGVYKGAAWASKRRLKKLEKTSGASA
jgi:hypothetical protein